MSFTKFCGIAVINLYFITFSAQAQPKLDSLWGVWEDPNQNDTTRFYAINDFIWDGILFSNPDSAEKLFINVQDFAMQLGNNRWVGRVISDIGICYYLKGDYEGALRKYEEAMELQRSIDDSLGLAQAFHREGVVYSDMGNYSKAIESFELSLGYRIKLGTVAEIADCYMSIGIVFKSMGDISKAIDYYQKSLRAYEKQKAEMSNLRGIANAHHNIGNLYWLLKEKEMAENHYKLSLDIFKEMRNDFGIARELQSLGILCNESERYECAETYFIQALELYVKLNNTAGEAKIRQSLAVVYNSIHLTEKAIYELNNAIRIFEALKEEIGLADSYSSLSRIYCKLGDEILKMRNATENNTFYKSAIMFGERGLSHARRSGNVQSIKNSAEVLYFAYKSVNDFQSALNTYELYIQMRDSISSESNIKELSRFEFQYEYEKKTFADSLIGVAENESLILSHQVIVAQKETERNLYASGGILLLLMTFIFFQRKINRNKLLLKEQEAAYQKEVLYATINSQETERRRIARDLHDEVGAMLATIKLNLGSVNIKLRQVGFEDDIVAPARNLVDDTISNVRSISKNLLPPTLEEFGLAHALSELADKVQEASGINIEKDIQLSINRLEVERELAIFRIIQEMINNALKHSSATIFKLVLKESNGQLEAKFSDNGVGFDVNLIKNSKSGQTGMGLKNLENRAGAAGAEIQLSSLIGQGTKLSLKMPMQFKAQHAA